MVLSFACCTVSLMSMRKEPSHRSEMVSQMLYGERAEILKLHGDYWAFIRCLSDDYEGWCLLGQLQILSKRDFHKEPKYINIGFHGKLKSEQVEILLPLGAQLRTGSMLLGQEKVKFKGKKLELKSLNPTYSTIEHIAKSFCNAPYLWGGRSLEGIDCSGFSQLVMSINGIQIARDASQQAQQGNTINFLQEAKCGDLAFFANPEGRVNHVGVLLDEHHIIHATETTGYVVIDKIDQEGIVSKLLRKRTHSLRLIKRFFEG